MDGLKSFAHYRPGEDGGNIARTDVWYDCGMNHRWAWIKKDGNNRSVAYQWIALLMIGGG